MRYVHMQAPAKIRLAEVLELLGVAGIRGARIMRKLAVTRYISEIQLSKCAYACVCDFRLRF